MNEPLLTDSEGLELKIREVMEKLEDNPHPSRTLFVQEARNLLEWKNIQGISGLWKAPPLMLTATLDDGWGHGLEIIRLFAEAAGMKVHHLGLLCSPESVIDECTKQEPDILGMTVLQFDSEEAMAQIRKKIPARTRIVAGGPLFRSDPEFAVRAGIDTVAKDATDFLNILLQIYQKSAGKYKSRSS